MKKNKPLIVGNWKTNPDTLENAKKKFLGIKKSAILYKNMDIVVCPPFTFIGALAQLSGKGSSSSVKISKSKKILAVGSQDVSFYEDGASKTGEVSAKMIESVGADYCIIGHSERRAMGETADVLRAKIQNAIKTSMNIIVCIGEKERDAEGGYLEVIKAQMKEILASVSRSDFYKIIIAYEPVWAIGRKDNVAITGYELHQMVVYIKKYLRDTFGDTISSMTKILYGGSVTAENAEDLIINGDIDGFLVGRASWDAESFKDIFYAVDTCHKNHSTKNLKKTLIKAQADKKKKKK